MISVLLSLTAWKCDVHAALYCTFAFVDKLNLDGLVYIKQLG